jgi:hypothetical protein
MSWTDRVPSHLEVGLQFYDPRSMPASAFEKRWAPMEFGSFRALGSIGAGGLRHLPWFPSAGEVLPLQIPGTGRARKRRLKVSRHQLSRAAPPAPARHPSHRSPAARCRTRGRYSAWRHPIAAVLAIDVDRRVAGVVRGNPALVPPPVRGYDRLLSLWNLGL